MSQTKLELSTAKLRSAVVTYSLAGGPARLIMLTLSVIANVLTKLAPVEKDHGRVVGWLNQVKMIS